MFDQHVSKLRRIYRKIATFPRKERAYAKWSNGQTIADITRITSVAEATAGFYVIEMVARGVGKEDLLHRLIREFEIQDKSFEEVQELN